MARLGSVRLGTIKLAGKLTSYIDLTDEVTLVSNVYIGTKDLTDGIVLYRTNSKILTDYLTIYNQSQKDLQDNLNLYYSTQRDLIDSLQLLNQSEKELTDNIGLYYSSFIDIEDSLIVYNFSSIDLTDQISLFISAENDLTDSFNIVYLGEFDIADSIDLKYQGFVHLEDNITLVGITGKNLEDSVNLVYTNYIDLQDNFNLDKYYIDLVDTISIHTLHLQGIYLYSDPQHTQLIPNDTQSFLYSFGDTIEEERIVPFYIVNGLSKNLTNLYVSISLNNPKSYYNQDMVWISKDNINYSINEIVLPTLVPLSGNQFFVKIKPLYGIDNNRQFNISFRIYKK